MLPIATPSIRYHGESHPIVQTRPFKFIYIIYILSYIQLIGQKKHKALHRDRDPGPVRGFRTIY